MVKYQGRRVEFKVQSTHLSAEFNSEVENIHPEIPPASKLLDDYWMGVWQILEEPESKKDLNEEDRRMLKLAMFGARNLMLQFGSTVVAFSVDPTTHRDNLNASIADIQNFVRSLSTPGLKLDLRSEEQRKALSNAAAIGFSTDKAKTKQWLFENLQGQVLEASSHLETRLLQIISNRNLGAQLPRDRRPSISELVHILEINRLIPRGGERKTREYAEKITRIMDRIDTGVEISKEEITEGDYTLAIAWFELILDDIR